MLKKGCIIAVYCVGQSVVGTLPKEATRVTHNRHNMGMCGLWCPFGMMYRVVEDRVINDGLVAYNSPAQTVL